MAEHFTNIWRACYRHLCLYIPRAIKLPLEFTVIISAIFSRMGSVNLGNFFLCILSGSSADNLQVLLRYAFVLPTSTDGNISNAINDDLEKIGLPA